MKSNKTKAYLPVQPVGRATDLIDSIDWQKYSVDQWLEQYGAWLDEGVDRRGIGHNIPAYARMYVSKGEKRPPRPMRVTCNITDDEARGVMRLLAELGGFDAKVLVYTYEWHHTIRQISQETGCSVARVHGCIANGKAWICGRAGMYRGHEQD